MAGGQGTRFWPLSRQSRPKQFLPLLGGRSLLEVTAERVAGVVPRQQAVVVVTEGQQPLVRHVLPDLPGENLLVEPVGRNTAPCMALAAASIASRYPEALVAALPADHYIHPADGFHRAIRAARYLAQDTDEVVTVGIRPTWPATGYGYLEAGEEAGALEGCAARRLVGFHEKPPKDRAASLVRSGRHFWNAGMFIVSVSRLLGLLERHAPDVYAVVSEVRSLRGTPDAVTLARAGYAELPSVSFDTAVMESYTGGYLIEAPFEWSDVGSWDAMAETWADESGNRVAGHAIAVDAAGCAVYSPRRVVALVGVEGIVVVDTEDALLVSRKGSTELVRDVVERLRRQGRDELL
jgi:mannose-1-phosphate guanylyltransferase